MVTKYIKVPAYLRDGDGERVKLTRKVLSDNRGFYDTINAELLKYSLDYQAFLGKGILLLPGQPAKHLPRGTVRIYDWMEWVHDDDGIHNVTSMLPVCLNIEDEKPDGTMTELWVKSIDDTRKLDIYLYIKLELKEELGKEELTALLNYISEQISDGWGENFWVEFKELKVDLSEDINEYKLVDEIYVPVWLPW